MMINLATYKLSFSLDKAIVQGGYAAAAEARIRIAVSSGKRDKNAKLLT